MYRDEIIEIISINKNRDLKNWYNSNIKTLAELLAGKLETENNLKAERDNSIHYFQVEISRKVVSR